MVTLVCDLNDPTDHIDLSVDLVDDIDQLRDLYFILSRISTYLYIVCLCLHLSHPLVICMDVAR